VEVSEHDAVGGVARPGIGERVEAGVRLSIVRICFGDRRAAISARRPWSDVAVPTELAIASISSLPSLSHKRAPSFAASDFVTKSPRVGLANGADRSLGTPSIKPQIS
jgi:hypothetical protein